MIELIQGDCLEVMRGMEAGTLLTYSLYMV